MSFNMYCWWCKKEHRELAVDTIWCPKCLHAIGRPPAQCWCLMCDPIPVKASTGDLFQEPSVVMPVAVDPVQWIKHVGTFLRMMPDDAVGMLTLHNAVCVGLQRLAELAISEHDHVTRNVMALEVMADVSGELMELVEVA